METASAPLKFKGVLNANQFNQFKYREDTFTRTIVEYIFFKFDNKEIPKNGTIEEENA